MSRGFVECPRGTGAECPRGTGVECRVSTWRALDRSRREEVPQRDHDARFGAHRVDREKQHLNIDYTFIYLNLY